jgi:hypothetical protein
MQFEKFTLPFDSDPLLSRIAAYFVGVIFTWQTKRRLCLWKCPDGIIGREAKERCRATIGAREKAA